MTSDDVIGVFDELQCKSVDVAIAEQSVATFTREVERRSIESPEVSGAPDCACAARGWTMYRWKFALTR